MDEVRAFFNNTIQPKKLRGPLTGGLRLTKENPLDELNRREEHRHADLPSGTDYARAVKDKETKMYLRNELEREQFESMAGGLESLEHLSSFGASTTNIRELTNEAMTEVYSKYSFQVKEDTNTLPINDFKEPILNRIQGFPVVIVEGPTGCGKTTQVPQWILDDCYQSRRPCKIVVTQPRRIAAISIAKRVAQERGWDVGGLVGYQVGLDAKVTNDTRIQYVTAGILLQKLVSAKTMNEYTHVILDEVHERGQEMDFLLLVVKKLLYTVSPGVKVVLMSATFNIKSFADYFMIPTPRGLQMASCIKVEKSEPIFTVKKFYLNHLNKFGAILHQSTPRGEEPFIAPEMHHLVIKLLNAFEHIDKNEDTPEEIKSPEIPSVLIFLPGIHEIEDLFACLTDVSIREQIVDKQCALHKWWVLPLHSTITSDEQARVFQRAPTGFRKIILATNVAESSITVPDIKYVIDYCLMKILLADQETNFTQLRLCWASKTNCEQRAGRAGRVRDGRVYRLVTDKFYENLDAECDPEIRRSPLERLVLLAKLLDMGSASDILALAMDPPNISNIHRTILVLKELGALKKDIDEEWCSYDGELTYLGRVAAKLPIDVKLSKLIMLGHIYGCLEETVVMAAGMSVKNLFNSPFRERMNAYNSRLTWADGSTSDCIAFLNVYRVWSHLRQQQHFRPGSQQEEVWARRFYVQARSLRELDEVVKDLNRRLTSLGIEPEEVKSPWGSNELSLVYKILIAGAFYPQYFIQVSSDESRERDAVRTLGGLDPRNTVYLKNFPDNQPAEIYTSAIKRAVTKQVSEEPRVTVDTNSQKIFLTFKDGAEPKKVQRGNGDPTIPGQVVLPVYMAVKLRQLRIDIRIPLLSPEKANQLALTMAAEKVELDIEKHVPRLPEIDDTHFPLTISQLVNINKFWVQYADESTAMDLNAIQKALNSKPLLTFNGKIKKGMLVAAPYTDAHTTAIYRVRITNLREKEMLEVMYIDYGSVGRVHTCNIRTLPSGLCQTSPPLAMRCRLAEVCASPLLDTHSRWTPAANQCFQNLTSRGRLLAKVYSVTQGIVCIELLANNGQLSVNKELVNQGYGMSCEESYESKMNHDVRETSTELNLVQKRAHNKEQLEIAYGQIYEDECPTSNEYFSDVCFRGPFSPLETNLYNLMYSSRQKSVHIESNSVNSVLLDTQPQENYERLVIAAYVGCNQENTKLTLRHTTVMPNIPGLPAIIALTFCPFAELRRNANESRYVSALCGLGSTEDGRPFFPEHDLLIDIDADIGVDDIGLINHVRHLTDYMMYCDPGQDMPNLDDEFRLQVPKLIRKDLMDLLLRRRKHRETESVPHAWTWRTVSSHELLEISIPQMLERAEVYSLHAPQELHPMSREALLALKLENDKLKMLVSRTPISSSSEMVCKLCNTKSMPLPAMRIHLYSNAHREKEEDFRAFQS